MKYRYVPMISLVLLHTVLGFAADTNIKGIIGGFGGTSYNNPPHSPYAAFIDENGVVTPLNFGFTNGTIGGYGFNASCVAINPSGIALLTGNEGNSGYAAFVGPQNQIIPLNLGMSNGSMTTVAINSSSLGLISGQSYVVGTGAVDSFGIAYAAFVKPTGEVSPLFLDIEGRVFFSAINDDGLGVIVGSEGTWPASPCTPYVSFVTPNSSLPSQLSVGTGGVIYNCDINDSGTAIVGGNVGPSTYLDTTNNNFYAAFVTSDGSVSPVNFGISGGFARAVAINDAGAGIVVGQKAPGSPGIYAAFMNVGSSSPQVISGLPTNTDAQLFSADINSSGVGIICGRSTSSGSNTPYAAFVAPNAPINPLNLNLSSGVILDGEIADNGIALIGGEDLTSGVNSPYPYAAIVAPNGTVTRLSIPGFNGAIVGVSIDLLSGPSSLGSDWGAFNSQFAASYALNTHMTEKHRSGNYQNNGQVSLLVSAEDNLPGNRESSSASQSDQNMLWISPFGNYVHQKSQGDNPSSSSSIGGFLVGYDYSYSDLMFGAAAGYAYNYLGFGSSAGHGSVQEELLTVYGSYEQECLLVNFALWGGLYQLYNKRNILWFAASKAHTQGWTFTPHFELATPFVLGNSVPVFLEPFAMFDYVSNWQGGYTEQGSSGLNLVMNSRYSSVLRSEAGLRLFEEFDVNIGKFVFMQKMSYVNQLPFYLGSVMTSFVASPSSFPIAIGSSHVQNLGAVELRGTYLPGNPNYPYFTFGFQGEFGSSYQSYFGSLEIGFAF